MRWQILGDITKLRTAVFYKRWQVPEKLFTIEKDPISGSDVYIPSPLLRKPYKHSVLVRSNYSDLSNFMEYNFKYKVDKGLLSSYTIQNYINDYTNNLLILDKDNKISNDANTLSLAESLLVFQKSGVKERKYNYFNHIVFPTFSEVILDLEGDTIIRNEHGEYEYELIPDGTYDDQGNPMYSRIIKKDYGPQKIEFYEEFLEDITRIPHEYIPELYNPNDIKPVLVVELGPNPSYEREDYQYIHQMPDDKPPVEERLKYNMLLDEFSNRKFIYITFTSDEKLDKINLSLTTHEREMNPHRNQNDIVVRNDHFNKLQLDKSLELSFKSKIDNNETLIFDKRSNTLLSTIPMDKSKYVILNDRISRLNVKVHIEYGKLSDGTIVRVTDENKDDIIEITESIDIPRYRRNVVYSYLDRVVYNDIDYESLSYGNLGENPQLSAIWKVYNPGKPDLPPIDKRVLVFIKNITLDSEEYVNNISDPVGDNYVNSGDDLTIRFLPVEGYSAYKVTVNGKDTQFTGNSITLTKIINITNVFIYYRRSSYHIELKVSPHGVPGLSATGTGDYAYEEKPKFLAKSTDYRYIFDHWEDSKGRILSFNAEYNDYEVISDEVITAVFKKGLATISIICTNGYSNISNKSVEYGSNLEIELFPYSGYVFDYLVDNNEVIKVLNNKYVLSDIRDNHSILVYFNRPKDSETDPNIGDIIYVTIGDYDWSVFNLEYEGNDIIPIKGDISGFGYYYQGTDINKLNNLLKLSKHGFHIPTKDEWINLINHVGGDLISGKYLKSSNEYDPELDITGWSVSNYSGLGLYLFNALPAGSVNIYGEINSFLDINNKSDFWTSTYNSSIESYPAIEFSYNSYKSEFINNKKSGRGLSIRLCRKTLEDVILGNPYKYKKYGDLYWTTSNLRFSELGSYYNNSESGLFEDSGKLYSYEDLINISNQLSGESKGWRIPSDDDWKNLERFLGLSDNLELNSAGYRGTIEGKRLKKDNSKYNNIIWDGFPEGDSENSGFKLIPDGFLEGPTNSYRDLGIMSKIWTSTVRENQSNLVWIREIIYNSPKIGRSSIDKLSRLSIRLVKDA